MKAELGNDILDVSTRRARREWEECWSHPVAAKQNWQRLALIEAVALIAAVFWVGHLGTLPKQELYVLERDKAGAVAYAGPVKPIDMDVHTWDLVKIQALKSFLESWRTVTTDRGAQANDWDRAFTYLGANSQAKQAIAQWYEQNDPIKRAAGGELVTVQFKTFDVEGPHTYGLWWQETTTSLSGQMISQKDWRARVVYDLHLPTSEQAREENSLGVLITELSWEPVQ